jgi:acetyl-CoA carboxylase carboxyl transferase subunit beta
MWFKKDKVPKEPRERRPSKVPEGLWVKCESCQQILYNKELARNFKICPKCGYHFRLSAPERLRMLFDDERYVELEGELRSTDPLRFRDSKRYRDRLKHYQDTVGTSDAIVIGSGTMGGIPVIIGAMEFFFPRGLDGLRRRRKSHAGGRAVPARAPSAGDRLDFRRRADAGGDPVAHADGEDLRRSRPPLGGGVPYISVMTDPTTGGVTASYAMLGDLNVAEPGALIGFAGPRVIEQTIRQTLPEGFQRSEFLLEHGHLDFVVERSEMKATLARAASALDSALLGPPYRASCPSPVGLARSPAASSAWKGCLRGGCVSVSRRSTPVRAARPARAARSLRFSSLGPTARARRRRRSRRSQRPPASEPASIPRLI